MRSTSVQFSLFGLRTSVAPAGVLAFVGLAGLAAVAAGWLLRLPLAWALSAGALSALVFFASEWLHQFGHALAARSVGYPMLGIHFFSILSISLYPPDEPPLPRAVHIRRALGGFWINLVLGVLCLPVALALYPRGAELLPPGPSVTAWLAAFSTVTNLLVLGLGAFLPIKLPGGGYTDGGTLWHYWRQER